MSRIFISYKRVDKDKVFKIKDQIESALGEKCWIDLDGIESDAQFKNVIIKAINECEIVLFMYSKAHSKIINFEKDWTMRELNFAAKKDKRIVFINLDGSPLTDAFEFDYGTKQHVDGLQNVCLEKLIQDLIGWRTVNKKAYSKNLQPQMIDLGLNVLWATSNVGSSEENIQGAYYAFGEVSPKNTYTKESYKTEVCTTGLQSCLNVEGGKDSLNSGQDVVYELFGEGYRLPTQGDILELTSKCTFCWTEKKGIKGYKVVGPNNNSIFLPVTGYRQGRTTFYQKSVGYYWLSDNRHNSKYSNTLFFDEHIIDPIADMGSFLGLAIRLVSEKKTESNISMPIGKYKIEVTWPEDDDLDMVAFLLNQDGVISDESDFVFYNSDNRTDHFDKVKYSNRRQWKDSTSPMSLDGSIIGEPIDWICIDSTIKTMMTLDLHKIRKEITEIIFGLSAYLDNSISSNAITLHIHDTNTFDIETTLTGMEGKTSLTICKLIRSEDNRWTFFPSLVCFEGGLQMLLDKYM